MVFVWFSSSSIPLSSASLRLLCVQVLVCTTLHLFACRSFVCYWFPWVSGEVPSWHRGSSLCPASALTHHILTVYTARATHARTLTPQHCFSASASLSVSVSLFLSLTLSLSHFLSVGSVGLFREWGGREICCGGGPRRTWSKSCKHVTAWLHSVSHTHTHIERRRERGLMCPHGLVIHSIKKIPTDCFGQRAEYMIIGSHGIEEHLV